VERGRRPGGEKMKAGASVKKERMRRSKKRKSLRAAQGRGRENKIYAAFILKERDSRSACLALSGITKLLWLWFYTIVCFACDEKSCSR
jgi:hypothetical protein